MIHSDQYNRNKSGKKKHPWDGHSSHPSHFDDDVLYVQQAFTISKATIPLIHVAFKIMGTTKDHRTQKR
jgi:hypothetical protein